MKELGGLAGKRRRLRQGGISGVEWEFSKGESRIYAICVSGVDRVDRLHLVYPHAQEQGNPRCRSRYGDILHPS